MRSNLCNPENLGLILSISYCPLGIPRSTIFWIFFRCHYSSDFWPRGVGTLRRVSTL